MENLKEAARFYRDLQNYTYKFIVSKKNRDFTLTIRFGDCDFWHAVGMGDLKDKAIFRMDKGGLLSLILDEDQELINAINNSPKFKKELYVERRKDFLLIQRVLESETLVFRSGQNLVNSGIKCDFIISGNITVHNDEGEEEIKNVWIFIKCRHKRKNPNLPNEKGIYSIVSCFSNNYQDFNTGQLNQKVLYKSVIFNGVERALLDNKV